MFILFCESAGLFWFEEWVTFSFFLFYLWQEEKEREYSRQMTCSLQIL